ncbi:D-cysteine desulfhydrase family protein [Pseudoalteromonas sp. Of7M-16]|uniref:D-cysteine desulfhydrase family protein n=1 Tax=Pseudoalteromonas sp. Of7M-16 TaxID=2917756 RepID=UPI001EF4999F|nr:D-cysteine desulfhydrase family protein [Pseudoalteromonas sp. Of7M-16]MCG7551671.1 D-cysteine desulfhydrase family protein [Pseudoalteromonas sp. Of7M-16]
MDNRKILQDFPKVELGFFPTPVVKLTNLSRHLGGPEILMKRDDLTGLALGGNKTRKLEYILGDALAKGCDTVVTAGAQQSNHCRQTAAAAAKLNMSCHLLLGGDKPDEATGNLLLDTLFGAQLHYCKDNRKGEDIPRLIEDLKSQGRKPYVIPYGGSNELGAIGFVEAGLELATQIDTDTLSQVFFASSSGGTHAGLMIARSILEHQYMLTGIQIDKAESSAGEFKQSVLALANSTSDALNLSQVFNQEDVILDDGYLGAGYGILNEREKSAIQLLAKTEGILLDPVYTGRAFAAMLDKIGSGKLVSGQQVLFWHTGGAPSVFAYADKLL